MCPHKRESLDDSRSSCSLVVVAVAVMEPPLFLESSGKSGPLKAPPLAEFVVGR